MKLVLFFIFSIFLYSSLSAQHQLSGVVWSSEKEPLVYALVSLTSSSDSTAFLTATTDDKGYFQLSLTPDNYSLSIQMLGQKTYTQELHIDADFDLGTILLTTDHNELATVEVTALHSTIENQLGKKILHIGQDLSATGSTALEALEQVPAVSTNSRGEVQIRGSTDVIIYVNGKETQRDPTTLQFISAEVLQKIEVLTNPSAKYDAEGVGGIINLVYKKNRWAQFKLEAVFNYELLTNPFFANPKGAMNWSINRHRLSFFCNASYELDKSISQSIFTRIHDTEELRNYQNDLIFRGNGSTTEVNTGISFEPDSTFSLGLEINYHRWDYVDEVLQTTRFQYLQQAEQQFEIPNLAKDLEDELWINWAIEKKFASKQLIKLSLTTGGEVEANSWQGEPQLSTEATQATEQFLLAATESESQRYYQGKLDWEMPLFNFGQLETGAQVDIINYDILQSVQLRADTLHVPDNDFQMQMQKLGLYALHRHQFKKLAYEVGVRAEQFASTARQEVNQLEFTQHYFLLFPSLQLDYLLSGRAHSIGLSYTRRINRPSFFELNPYISYEDPLNLETGNPELRPEIGRLFEINYHRALEHWTFNANLFQRTTEDAIQDQITTLHLGQTLTKPINIGKWTSRGLELEMEQRWKKWLKTTATFVARQAAFTDDNITISFNHRWTWQTRLRQQFSLKNQWRIQWTATYRAPSYQIQQKRAEAFYMDIGVSKKLTNQRGSLTLSVRDIFNTKNYNYLLLVDNFQVEQRHKWQTRRIILGVRYNLIDNKKRG